MPSSSVRSATSITLTSLGLLVLAVSARAETREVSETIHAILGGDGHQVYAGTVELAAEGIWRVNPRRSESIREVYLTPSQPARLRQLGNRMYVALEEKQIRYDRSQLQMGYEACRQFAQENDGVGPASIGDLAGDKQWDYVARRWDQHRWHSNALTERLHLDDEEGPNVFLVPNSQFDFSEPDAEISPRGGEGPPTPLLPGRKTVMKENSKVLAFERRPFVDDGKHWVLYTDGRCERIEIDLDTIQHHDVEIRPIVNREEMTRAADRPTVNYRIVLVCESTPANPLAFDADNPILDRTDAVTWDLSQASESAPAVLREEVSQARTSSWTPYLNAGAGGILRSWSQSTNDVENVRDPRRDLSLFSVLGGRAAIEETLQLQNLVVPETGESETVDIDSLQGVEVKSHPFDELLDGEPGGRLELAELVPPDRLLVYVGKPETIPALLDRGAPFIAGLGTSLTGNCLHYNLEGRYLARLGMTRDWVDAVFASGLTSEMVLFAPDLFFIDSTDVTVAARLTQPQLLREMLSLLNARELASNSIVELPTTAEQPAYMALRGDLLFASTNRGELERSLNLRDRQGEGSLGRSAEFRYMLTQLDVNDRTRFYVYFSDPFVRRLVGPRVKIGQRRRMIEKAQMEALTASAMLAQLDGCADAVVVDDLVSGGYLPKDWNNQRLSFNEAGLVRSERYGPLPRLRTLEEVPLEKVTQAEAEAYRRYLENYSRYWNRFFDPIAIRLDEVGRNQLELSTFILPLVDNSIYNGLRQVLAHEDDDIELSIPIVQPSPLLQFSVNLNEQAWQQITGDFSEFFARYSGASPSMMDDLGPSAHVAIFDADPIIALGSGDVFGAFGGNVLRGGGNQMLFVPIALSMLTRPCSIIVETQDPERTAQHLRQAANRPLASDRTLFGDFRVAFYQEEDRDRWVWTMELFGAFKLRYGVEVSGNHLIIRNFPWSSDDRVVSTMPAVLNASRLQVNPAACREQLPGLFAAAADGNRKAVMSGIGRLYPFLLAGADTVEEAIGEHDRRFGFHPRSLPGDQWTWQDMRLRSDDYGDPTSQRQPSFDPSEPFGLMNQIESLELNMQFEQDGLRSHIRWRTR